MKLAVVAVGFLFASTSFANGAGLDSIYEFLTKNVEKVELVAPEQEFVIEAGKLVGVSSKRRTIQNVIKKDNYIKFTVLRHKIQTNFKLDAQGQKILPGNQVNGIYMSECTFVKRHSAHKILGNCFTHGEAGWDTTGALSFDGVTLTIKSKNAAEFDDGYSASGNGWKPVTLTYDEDYKLENGQLILKLTEKGFDYDIETGKTADAPYGQVSSVFTGTKK